MDRQKSLLSELTNLAIVGMAAALLFYFGLIMGKRTILPFKVSDSRPVAEYPYTSESGPKDLYLNLMKLTLCDLVYDSPNENRDAKVRGKTWPIRALTMIGLKRLDNIQTCMEDVLEREIPGDFIEAGAWRGGATIFMRAVLKAENNFNRKVWVADSFEGLPPPDLKSYPEDLDVNFYRYDILAVSKETVENNFRRFGLFDSQVIFLKGFFKDTLPRAPIEKLAVLRIDADMYESTIEALTYLYPKLSPGGYAIIDDYHTTSACWKAVEDYRKKSGVKNPVNEIDGEAVYWEK